MQNITDIKDKLEATAVAPALPKGGNVQNPQDVQGTVLSEFEKFKKDVLEGGLIEDYSTGFSLKAKGASVIYTSGIYAFPQFIKDNFIEALKVLAAKRATHDFHYLIKSYCCIFGLEPLKSLINAQNTDFIEKCGSFLLFSAMKLNDLDFCKFLINEKNVSLNSNVWCIDRLTIFHCAMCIFSPSPLEIQEPKRKELIELLITKKADVNCAMNGENLLTGANGYCRTVVKSLLMAGISPFSYREINDSPTSRVAVINVNALSEAIDASMNAHDVPLLCEFGAGLMLREARFPCDIRPQNVGPAGAQARQAGAATKKFRNKGFIEFYYCRLRQLAVREGYESPDRAAHFAERFQNAEIAFKTCETVQEGSGVSKAPDNSPVAGNSQGSDVSQVVGNSQSSVNPEGVDDSLGLGNSQMARNSSVASNLQSAEVSQVVDDSRALVNSQGAIPPQKVQARWIFDLKEFREYVNAQVQQSAFDLMLQTRIFNLFANLLAASDEIVSPDVKKVAEDAVTQRQAKGNLTQLTLFELNQSFNPPLVRLVLSYSMSELENAFIKKWGYESVKKPAGIGCGT